MSEQVPDHGNPYNEVPKTSYDVDVASHRSVKLMDTEYELAQAIMGVVKTYLELHPEIDTCKVSRLCEMMLVYV